MGRKKQKKLIQMEPNELIDLLIDSVRKNQDELRINEISSYILLGMIPKEEKKIDWSTGKIHDPFAGFTAEKLFEKARELTSRDDAQSHIDVITKIAAELFLRDYVDHMKKKEFTQLNDDDKMALMKKRHPEFTSKYPIVAQYLVFSKIFHHTAFHKFLLKTKSFYEDTEMRKLDKKKAWCMLQAYYVKFLLLEYNKRMTAEEAGKFYQETADKMIKDYEEFEDEYKEHEENIKKLESKNKKEMLNNIIENIDSLNDTQLDKLEEEMYVKYYKQVFSSEIIPLVNQDRVDLFEISGDGKNVFAPEYQMQRIKGV